MKIAVGSKNPVKIAAVENVARKVWPNCEVTGVEVDSGISVQPRSDDEAIEGAVNRAKLALVQNGADFGVGIEARTVENKHGMFTGAWAAVVDKNGVVSVGGGNNLLLPEKVAHEIRKGRELGPVMDEFIGEENVKQKQGASGVLTNGLVPRTESLEKAVAYALAKFLVPHLYK